MRRPILLAAVLTGCLNLTALAEAHDRHGQASRQARSFAHQSFAHQTFAHQTFAHRSFAHQSFAGRSFAGQSFGRPTFVGRPAFAPGRNGVRFADRRSPHWFGPPSGMRGFAPPHRRPQFAQARPAWRFGPRQHVRRFIGPIQGPPLSRVPGNRILAGRQILPFVGRPARLARPFVVVRRHPSPTFVRAFPGPGFGFHDGFAFPRSQNGTTIIVR